MARSYRHPAIEQLSLPFGPVRNSNLFSNHWLEHRLALEPEWRELGKEAEKALESISSVWAVEKKRVEKYENEQSLEYALIQPVLESLGWKIIYQTFLRGRKPDYALFLEDESKDAALNVGKNSPAFWSFPTLLADAKPWGTRLDRPIRLNNQREYPPEQIEWYVNQSGLPYGILTNGACWRLVPREHAQDQPRFQTYLECDLPAILDAWLAAKDLVQREEINRHFLRFYLFFSPAGYRAVEGRTPLVTRAKQGSSEYRLGIGEDLKMRVFEALRFCIEGFLKFPPNHLDEGQISLCREQSFVFLYRLLFAMYAEDRGLLPYRKNHLYTENRSLGRFRVDVAANLDKLGTWGAKDYSKETTSLWDDLENLFDLIDSGKKAYGIPAYNGGLFARESNGFLATRKISDWHLARVIDQLGRAPDPEHPRAGLYRVDYRDLQIQHLGNIYEGLLELDPHIVTEPRVVIRPKALSRRHEETSIAARAAVPKGFEITDIRYEPGDVELLTDKGERRSTGSYYTPNHIVDHLVEKALRPLCKSIDAQLRDEIARTEKKFAKASSDDQPALKEALERLCAEYDDRVLNVRILDPAMGSGHFLLRACQYLAEEIATHPLTGDREADAEASDESAITFWKRRVVERCLYGVDRNPLAVELAKLALWVETVAADQPLSFLDHHLRCGDSLVGADLARIGSLHGSGYFESLFEQHVQAALPAFLTPLEEIRAMPSDTPNQVKAKTRLYRDSFEKARQPFLRLANLWCADLYLTASKPSVSQYETAVQALASPVRFKKMSESNWFHAAVGKARKAGCLPFHWDLEFPEVFYNREGRLPCSGFDAIIGNPPYDVLSEKETGADLSAFRRFIQAQPIYASSLRGKNNLYKLFICRALSLLAERGRLAFIVPMALLGDDQSAAVRAELLKQGALESVEAFPQKDDPRRRVFPEAKLSTVAFSFAKTADAQEKNSPFFSRIHPANQVEEASPALRLTTADIPLYDAQNLSVVACSQEDWDLAVRIMGSGRMERLGKLTEFFQGEVNETNERAKGNLAEGPRNGTLVTRGASICLYVTRPASQGEDLYLNVESFLRDKGQNTKAFHHHHRRIGLQESCPQNNFRRIIAAIVPTGDFLNHKVNYCTEAGSNIPLEMTLALLNSKIADWYFRLGSTNASVSHYQLYNLPCPIFAASLSASDRKPRARALETLEHGDTQTSLEILVPLCQTPPFSLAVRDVMIAAVNRIVAIERDRGAISRQDRSALAPPAQPYQDLIDQLLYALAGLTPAESAALEERLRRML